MGTNLQRVGKHNTTVQVFKTGGIVKYHGATVVSWWRGSKENGVRLSSNGKPTTTARTRMNQAANEYGLGYLVYQRDFTWFLKIGDTEPHLHVKFFDGITFDPVRKVVLNAAD